MADQGGKSSGVFGFLERTLGFGATTARKFATIAVLLYIVGLVNGYRLATQGEDLLMQIVVPILIALLAYFSTEIAVIVAFVIFYLIFFIL